MRNIFNLIIFTGLLSIIIGCSSRTNRNLSLEITVLPLGKVNPEIISYIKEGIKQFYGKVPVIEKSVPFTDDILTKSKTRYEASKILAKYNCHKNLLIITEKDIAIKYHRRKSDEWGIFGLGYRPGQTCVVSTFRLRRKAGKALFKERLIKVCIHEIGHNLGLDHCKFDPKCLMNDANGTISQVDKEGLYFCEKCRKQLHLE